MLKSDENRIIINDFVQGEPLSEENLDRTLNIATEFNKRYKTTQDIVSDEDNDHNILNETIHKFRLSFPNKSIWLYTGYKLNLQTEYTPVDDFWNDEDEKYYYFTTIPYENSTSDFTRSMIISRCNVVVDGRYIDSQRNSSKKWSGSNNQNCIDIQQSLQQNKIVLYCD